MPAINEDLILKVLDEMVKNRSSLSKYIPEKDEDEETDYRIIGDLVIKNYPWPIGVELRRLFSGSMRQPGNRYLATEVTEKCDLRSLSNYNILLEEYRELMLAIGGFEV
jgi:hypothetical protein